MNQPTASKFDSDELLPLLYNELRRVAKARLAREPSGQSLNTTGLVHEVYVRLKETMPDLPWNSRAHFFGAAAEAMRRILVERARARGRLKRGEGIRPVELQDDDVPANDDRSDEILAVHESLDELGKHDSTAAALVKLRYFGGLSHQEAASELGITRRQADGLWALARTWLRRRMRVD
jgi:RNA polymerase sigma factor (TIGR02999 family)